mmetsp:Transcript_2504/g.7537  ORF Transcript_2504/g.7537 Transcript_2504/m.7537 type:complete len:429 (-) Transcript_2504:2387-3673(-)
MDKGIAAAEQLYLDEVAEVEVLLKEDPTDQDALVVLADLRAGLKALRATIVNPSIEEPPVVVGPTWPMKSTPASEGDEERPTKRQRSAAGKRSVTGDNNARMHPGTGYAEQEPDFAALAARDADLAPFVRTRPDGSGVVDFANPAASKAVTAALLRHDYGVQWALPDGHLIPPVPGRANYIAWIADLLALSCPPGQVVGLDIGCGANLIYPLLGAAVHGWKFVAVDVTDVAMAGARANAALNPHLVHLIEVRDARVSTGQEASPGGGSAASPVVDIMGHAAAFPDGIVRPAVLPDETFAFCMCNPPFFESMEQAGLNPRTAHAGTAAEMVCPGGEAAFVGAMVADSLQLGGRVHWHTAMLGRKSSLKALRATLYRHRATALRTTEFSQGRTSRWGLAWSFAVSPSTAASPLVRQPRPPRLAVPPPAPT